MLHACTRRCTHTHMHALLIRGTGKRCEGTASRMVNPWTKTTQRPWANRTSQHTRTHPPTHALTHSHSHAHSHSHTHTHTHSLTHSHRVIYEYGEERKSRSIARKIVAARLNKPIETTLELCRIIGACISILVIQ